MKFYLVSLFSFIIIISTVNAQQVSISPVLNSGNESSIVHNGPGEDFSWIVEIQGDVLHLSNLELELDGFLSYDISPDNRHLAVLREKETFMVQIYNTQGILVAQYTDVGLIDVADPSLKLFLLHNGSIVIRDNIAGFTLFTQTDLFVNRVSNTSGASDGEEMSRMAASPDGKRTVMYIPRFIESDGIGSQINILDMSGRVFPLFKGRDRTIEDVVIGDDSDVIHIVFNTGSGKELYAVNEEGDVLSVMKSELDDPDFTIQPEFNTITWFQGNQAQVYDMTSGERLALAFLRGENIVYAVYNPDDNVVVTLTGRRNNRQRTIQASAVRVVDITDRVILGSDALNTELSFTDDVLPGIQRLGANRYRVTGVTNSFDIQLNR